MLVQALVKYAETYLKDQLADPAFQDRPVPYAIQVFDDGAFAEARPRLEEETTAKGRTFKRPRALRVPRVSGKRQAGQPALLGCDSVSNVLGPNPGVWSKPEEVEKHTTAARAFRDLLEQAAHETGDSALRACAKFLADEHQVARAKTDLAGRQAKGSELVTFTVVPRDTAAQDSGEPVVLREEAQAFWRKRFREIEAQEAGKIKDSRMCLVHGETGPYARTTDKVKGTASLGGQPSGVALMSFDKDAFGSYGWDRNANSPVCPGAATAHVFALNDLLRPGKHRQGSSRDRLVRTRFDFGGVGFLFWTREPTDDDLWSLFDAPSPDDIHALLTAPATGNAGATADANEFYFAAVSGNGGRLLVRDWFHDTLDKVKGNVSQWFSDLSVPDVFKHGQPADPPKLWQLLTSLSPARVKSDDPANAGRSVQLMRRALHGLPLGHHILAAALDRQRQERGSKRLSPGRVGLVRMCVNDIAQTKGEPLMTETLNPKEQSSGCVCGRLMAVYEKLQYAAQGDTNVTVTDRYYDMAMTYPVLAFTKLDSLSKAHLKKLRRDNPGAMVAISRDLHELVNGLPGGEFPKALSLEEQGRFVVGYHHQKAEDARRAAEAKARKATGPHEGVPAGAVRAA